MRAFPFAFALLACIAAASPAPAKETCGDVRPSSTGVPVDVGDAVAVLRMSAGLIVPTPAELVAADVAPPADLDDSTVPPTVNPAPDGVVDVADAVQVLRIATGLAALQGCSPAPARRPRLMSVEPRRGCADSRAVVRLSNPSRLAVEIELDGRPVRVVDSQELAPDDPEHPSDDTDLLTIAFPELDFGSAPELELDLTVTHGLDPLPVRLVPDCTFAPELASITPDVAARSGRERLTVTGDHLTCVREVRFRDVRTGSAQRVAIRRIVSNAQIVVDAPVDATGEAEDYDLVASNACGSAVLESALRLSSAAPDATSIEDVTSGRALGSAAGGNGARLLGIDLQLADRLTIGDIELERNVDFWADAGGGLVVPSMPPSPAGPFLTLSVPVTVGWGAHRDPTPVTWTYQGLTSISCVAVDPTSGPASGGTTVVVEGVSLNEVDAVLFGDVPSLGVFYPTTDGTRLVAVAPAFALPVTVDVTLEHDGLAVSSCRGGFTFFQ